MAEGDYLFTLYKASLSSKRIAYKKYLCDVFYIIVSFFEHLIRCLESNVIIHFQNIDFWKNSSQLLNIGT